eukprot:978130-Pleurochrysis_carterae.AAC.1
MSLCDTRPRQGLGAYPNRFAPKPLAATVHCLGPDHLCCCLRILYAAPGNASSARQARTGLVAPLADRVDAVAFGGCDGADVSSLQPARPLEHRE